MACGKNRSTKTLQVPEIYQATEEAQNYKLQQLASTTIAAITTATTATSTSTETTPMTEKLMTPLSNELATEEDTPANQLVAKQRGVMFRTISKYLFWAAQEQKQQQQ